MCDVRRATGPSGETVAVKILRSEFSSGVLHDEIHLITSLSHPGIVSIHAWGDATPLESAALRIPVGTPWVAMEYADGGSLEMSAVRSYGDVRYLALSLLDALMHAHARGVIHRDIKPGNILLHHDPLRYVLTDFGIAFPKSRVREGTYEVPLVAAGTTSYIAPEQLIGRWRDFNSYTDLFSLGAVLFELVTGKVPFTGASRVDVALAHQRGVEWPAELRFEVPPGFGQWMMTLLATDPTQRFAFAADAAHALLQLGETEAPSAIVDGAAFDHAPTIPEHWGTTVVPPAQTRPTAQPAIIHLGGPRPPLPADWRPHWWGAPGPARVAAAADMVGRESERDTLWAVFRDVVSSFRSRTVLLRGPSGIGASRLARWLCERAHELGAADDIFVWRRHGASALSDTVRHVLRLGGLDARDRNDRLRELLVDANIDVQLVGHLAMGLPLAVQDQVHVIEAILAHYSQRRPLIIWVDDAHKDLEVLQVTARLTAAPYPVMFVLTLSDEPMSERPYQEAVLEEHRRQEATTELQLGPMPQHELHALIGAQHDDETFVTTVVAAARGNPLRALQLAELLRSSDLGDALGDLDVVWRQRVAALNGEQRAALLAAAVLGVGVNTDLWSRLCRRCDIPQDASTIDRFVQQGLWSATSHGYAFTHESLRHALLTDDAARAPIRAMNLEAARLYNTHHTLVALRARHLLSGGEYLEAARVTYEAAFAFHGENRSAVAGSVAESLACALDRAGVSEDHPARDWARLVLAYQPAKEGRIDDALHAVSEVVDSTTPAADPTLHAEALRNRSYLEAALGKRLESLATAYEAFELRDGVLPTFVTGLYNRLGRALFDLGRASEALTVFEEGARHAKTALAQVAAQVGHGHCLAEVGRIEDARRLLSGTTEIARGAGMRLQLAHALNALADAERRQGDLGAARKHYEEVLRVVERTSPQTRAIAELNLALCLLRTQPARARDFAEQHIDSTHAAVRFYGEFVMAATAAYLRDESWWDNLTLQDVHSTEYAQVWVDAAEQWIGHGDLLRADQALNRAQSALTGLDHDTAREFLAEVRRRRAKIAG